MNNAQYALWFTLLSAFGIQFALIFSSFTKEEQSTESNQVCYTSISTKKYTEHICKATIRRHQPLL